MASNPPPDNPSQNMRGAKVASSTEDRRLKERSQSRASLRQSTSGQDVNGSSSAKRIAPEPGPSRSDGPEDSNQATPGTSQDTTGPASRLDSAVHDGGARKAAEPATSAGGGDPQAKDLNQDQKEGPDSDASPSPAAPKPTLEESWKTVMKEVVDIDEAQCRDWDEDIDTLLVFAGLFSAVVTAFTIESYKWLSPDPQDTSVALLTQIAQQMRNETIASTSPELFNASSSVIRINTCWFLSLISSLITALFGLLCKQWLREHRRPTHTRTPQEALALHWLRHESLKRWHVSTFLTALPILLQLALFLFFAGLLELLWSCHLTPFITSMVVVGVATLFYIGTTIMPGVNIICQAWQVTEDLRDVPAGKSDSSPVKLISSLPPMEFICPYKSSQAWVAFLTAQFITHSILWLLGCMNICPSSWYHKVYISSYYARAAAKMISNNLPNWPSVDLEIIQRSDVKLVPPFYKLKAFRWLVQELQDTPSMIPHLQNTLGTLPLHLVMSAVLDQWFFHPQRDWTMADMRTALQPNYSECGIEKHQTLYQRWWLGGGDPPHWSPVFQQLLHYNHILVNWREAKLEKWDWDHLVEVWKELWRELEPTTLGSMIGLPFSLHTLDEILNNPEHTEPGLKLFQSCTDQSLHPQWFTHYYPLAHNLAQHIIATSTPHHQIHRSPVVTNSPLVRSPTCLALIEQVHDHLVNGDMDDIIRLQDREWLKATDIIQHIHKLPMNHFPLLPHFSHRSLTKLEGLLWELPDEPSDSDFGFLDSWQKHWTEVWYGHRADFINILSKYINEYPNLRVAHNKHLTNTPLATHQKGLEFIGFLYVEWRKPVPEDLWERSVHNEIWGLEGGAWTRVLECVRTANRGSPNMFEAMLSLIPHSNSESPPVNNPLSQIQGGNTSTGAYAGGGNEDSTVKGAGNKGSSGTDDSDGAEPQSHKGTNQAMEQPVKESGDSGVCHTSQGGESVGGVGADDNV
ncbi:hypothetical protein V5O48_009338 [Marasmius crinis-equi]|uniref:DUF6535 domain-containing protein n=1 Tax=Marasmius crinis-equi TaxID=585013 RepID=A0ABR3FBE2_9AGAR